METNKIDNFISPKTRNIYDRQYAHIQDIILYILHRVLSIKNVACLILSSTNILLLLEDHLHIYRCSRRSKLTAVGGLGHSQVSCCLKQQQQLEITFETRKRNGM